MTNGPTLNEVRYELAEGATLDEMRENALAGDLFKLGDMALVWVNQGDLDASCLRGMTARGMAARSGETEGLDRNGNSPVAEGHAPQSPDTET